MNTKMIPTRTAATARSLRNKYSIIWYINVIILKFTCQSKNKSIICIIRCERLLFIFKGHDKKFSILLQLEWVMESKFRSRKPPFWQIEYFEQNEGKHFMLLVKNKRSNVFFVPTIKIFELLKHLFCLEVMVARRAWRVRMAI